MNKNKAPAPTLEDEVRKLTNWYRQFKPSVQTIRVNATTEALLKFCYWDGDDLCFDTFEIISTHVPKLTRKQYEKQQQKI